MKMLKHLFGKRDKELDVLQEEALQSPLRTVVRNFTSNLSLIHISEPTRRS